MTISRLAGQNLAQLSAISAVFTHIAKKSPLECALLKQHLTNAVEAHREKFPSEMPEWIDVFDSEIKSFDSLLRIISDAHVSGQIPR